VLSNGNEMYGLMGSNVIDWKESSKSGISLLTRIEIIKK
jgi:hypothetical protein